jgi:N-hydroxyarylamine O-acetyltransferase
MVDAAAYLERIGYRGASMPTTETLRALHLAHLRAVPFENLDIHLGRPIILDEELLFDKIVRRRRGGFCYELNGLFAVLLRQIGFDVTLLAAQFPAEEGAVNPELDHLILLVRAEDSDQPLLADVGGGRGSFAYPLLVQVSEVQTQAIAGASFRLLPEGERCQLWRQEPDGDWERSYAFTWQPRQFGDFTEACWFHQSSPESHFTQKRLCTLLTAAGRITLSEQRLITTVNGTRSEQELDDAAYVETLRAAFGIDLTAKGTGDE